MRVTEQGGGVIGGFGDSRGRGSGSGNRGRHC